MKYLLEIIGYECDSIIRIILNCMYTVGYIYIKVPWFYHLMPSLYHGIVTVKVENGETDGERIFYCMNLEIKQEVEKRAGL